MSRVHNVPIHTSTVKHIYSLNVRRWLLCNIFFSLLLLAILETELQLLMGLGAVDVATLVDGFELTFELGDEVDIVDESRGELDDIVDKSRGELDDLVEPLFIGVHGGYKSLVALYHVFGLLEVVQRLFLVEDVLLLGEEELGLAGVTVEGLEVGRVGGQFLLIVPHLVQLLLAHL